MKPVSTTRSAEVWNYRKSSGSSLPRQSCDYKAQSFLNAQKMFFLCVKNNKTSAFL